MKNNKLTVLPPGQGALLNAPSTFTNTFVGDVLAPDGSIFNGYTLNPPPVFTGTNGVYLLSSKFPQVLSGTDTNLSKPVFPWILGREPLVGEKFTRLDPVARTYQTTTFFGCAWDNGAPALNIGEAGLFTIGASPIQVDFRVTSIAKEGDNVRITWLPCPCKPNHVQATTGGANGSYSNNLTDLDSPIIPTSLTATNYLHTGGAYFPALYYRVRYEP